MDIICTFNLYVDGIDDSFSEADVKEKVGYALNKACNMLEDEFTKNDCVLYTIQDFRKY